MNILPLLTPEKEKPYFQELMKFLDYEYANHTIFPPRRDIFNALKHTPDIKVVILGQDPYHGRNQAHGFAFSVNDGQRMPPSLINIFKEIGYMPKSGNLEYLAKQGVLLLNTVLTVRENQANSHKDKGWEIFTNRVIELINEQDRPVVFMLWGSFAQQKSSLITKHPILKTSHPSPLSAHRGFLGSGHFRKANEILISTGQTPINWTNSHQ
ncbi:MAG: uracil-DNA glycosylase [Candidatus Epulonipiscioides saccharophilum]|nr:MAG: uracil-DNA glycosylase [Epulopiscium sp. AS2M-Bin001]